MLYYGRPTKRVQDSEDYKYISNKWRRFQYSSEGKKEEIKKIQDKKEERRDGGNTWSTRYKKMTQKRFGKGLA